MLRLHGRAQGRPTGQAVRAFLNSACSIVSTPRGAMPLWETEGASGREKFGQLIRLTCCWLTCGLPQYCSYMHACGRRRSGCLTCCAGTEEARTSSGANAAADDAGFCLYTTSAKYSLPWHCTRSLVSVKVAHPTAYRSENCPCSAPNAASAPYALPCAWLLLAPGALRASAIGIWPPCGADSGATSCGAASAAADGG